MNSTRTLIFSLLITALSGAAHASISPIHCADELAKSLKQSKKEVLKALEGLDAFHPGLIVQTSKSMDLNRTWIRENLSPSKNSAQTTYDAIHFAEFIVGSGKNEVKVRFYNSSHITVAMAHKTIEDMLTNIFGKGRVEFDGFSYIGIKQRPESKWVSFTQELRGGTPSNWDVEGYFERPSIGIHRVNVGRR